jgi:hypothetical protein
VIAFFRALSVFRDMRAVAHGPRATVSRVARKHIYRAVGRSVR